DRVALELLDHAEGDVAVDVEVDQHVEAGVGDERLAERTPLDGDRHGLGVEPVDHAGDLALDAEALGRATARFAAGGSLEGDLSHRYSYFRDRAGAHESVVKGASLRAHPLRHHSPQSVTVVQRAFGVRPAAVQRWNSTT